MIDYVEKSGTVFAVFYIRWTTLMVDVDIGTI